MWTVGNGTPGCLLDHQFPNYNMDNQENKSNPKDNDIELGSLFVLIGKGFKSLGRSLSSGGQKLGSGLVNILFFLKRRLIWILLAGAAGFAWGMYTGSGGGPKYYSEMTARFNFKSTLTLYNTVDYLNALISNQNRQELSALLSISEQEARHLVNFSVEPIMDELTISELYKRNFMLFDRSYQIRTDTFWTRIIPYEKFKSSLTKFDIPLQRVRATGTRPEIFHKIQPGLLKLITENENLRSNFSINTQMQSEEEGIILSSIRGLDTLRTVYNEKLRQSGPSGAGVTNVNLFDRTITPGNPELQLYDKLLGLRDELRSLRNNAMNNGRLVQVYASFNPVGKKVSLLQQNVVETTIGAMVIALVILVAIEAFKTINAYERRIKRRAPGAQ